MTKILRFVAHMLGQYAEALLWLALVVLTAPLVPMFWVADHLMDEYRRWVLADLKRKAAGEKP